MTVWFCMGETLLWWTNSLNSALIILSYSFHYIVTRKGSKSQFSRAHIPDHAAVTDTQPYGSLLYIIIWQHQTVVLFIRTQPCILLCRPILYIVLYCILPYAYHKDYRLWDKISCFPQFRFSIDIIRFKSEKAIKFVAINCRIIRRISFSFDAVVNAMNAFKPTQFNPQ